MSCGKKSHCVCNVVKDIVAAQDEVANNNKNDCCSTSCERSIADLLSPVANGNENGNGNTTIPFILYCKSDCAPFFASGVYPAPATPGTGSYFACIEPTPIFRAKNFVENGDCCVRLELMLPVNANGALIDPANDGDEVCDFFQDAAPNRTRNFQATGVCITVDLNSFNAIECLNPVTPLPSSQFLSA